MPHYNIYKLKIKIISIHFKIRAINDLIQFQLYLGQKLKDLKEIEIKHGLLVDSATLQCQISDKDIQSNHSMQIVLIEKHKMHQERLGNIVFAFQEFKNIKMRKFQVENCFDKSAYLEAFLLLLPTRQVEETQIFDDQMPVNQNLQINLQKAPSKSSVVDIKIEQEKSENSSVIQYQNQQSPSDNEEYEVTFNASERLNTASINGSEKLDINSLITLNDILNEANNQLANQNKSLKQTLHKLEEKYQKQTQSSKDTEKSLKQKINELQLKLRQKETQLKKKCEQIEKLLLQNQNYRKQVAQLRASVKSQIKEQLKIDSLILQLGKYSDTANRYRSKTGSQNRKSEMKLTPLPKMPIITLTKENFFKEGIKTSRSIKQMSKSMGTGKQKQSGKHDETLDTMKEVSSIVIPK